VLNKIPFLLTPTLSPVWLSFGATEPSPSLGDTSQVVENAGVATNA